MSTPSSFDKNHIVIIGAGVIGLTIAHVLASKDPSLKIKIVARDLPEDLESQAWSSPWAGANWAPFPEYDAMSDKWERATFNKLWDMIPSGLSMELPSLVYATDYTPEQVGTVWWKDLVRNFRVLPADEVPEKFKSGLAFSTISINPHSYLPWLKTELENKGVEFIRKQIGSLDDAVKYGDVIINATGLGARSLIGVEDLDVYPIRGQGVIVECPGLQGFYAAIDSSIKAGFNCYIISRPGGTSILGGTFLEDVWDTSIDYATSKEIISRCTALMPQLSSPETKILSHCVGLRPARRGGPRIEAEWVDLPSKDRFTLSQTNVSNTPKKHLVIHAYGFGASGYQKAWGAAEEVYGVFQKSV